MLPYYLLNSINAFVETRALSQLKFNNLLASGALNEDRTRNALIIFKKSSRTTQANNEQKKNKQTVTKNRKRLPVTTSDLEPIRVLWGRTIFPKTKRGACSSLPSLSNPRQNRPPQLTRLTSNCQNANRLPATSNNPEVPSSGVHLSPYLVLPTSTLHFFLSFS